MTPSLLTIICVECIPCLDLDAYPEVTGERAQLLDAMAEQETCSSKGKAAFAALLRRYQDLEGGGEPKVEWRDDSGFLDGRPGPTSWATDTAAILTGRSGPLPDEDEMQRLALMTSAA